MSIEQTNIDPVKIIHQFRADDQRGSFIKTFHQSALRESGIHFEMKESFYSVSVKNVFRGIHFHHPPFDHDKIVFCTNGAILDIALDLRKNSLTYGKSVTTELSFENNKALYIPKGFAHGFLTLSDHATTFYFVSGEYQQTADDGIRFDSVDLKMNQETLIISDRDKTFKHLDEFISPF